MFFVVSVKVCTGKAPRPSRARTVAAAAGNATAAASAAGNATAGNAPAGNDTAAAFGEDDANATDAAGY